MDQKQTNEETIATTPKSCCGCCKPPPAREAAEKSWKPETAAPSEPSADSPCCGGD
jgi:hypothetical protein